MKLLRPELTTSCWAARLSPEQQWDVPALLGTHLQPLGRGFKSRNDQVLSMGWSTANLNSHGDSHGPAPSLLLTSTHRGSWPGSPYLLFLQPRAAPFDSNRDKLGSPNNAGALEMGEEKPKPWVYYYRNKILNPPGLDDAAATLTGISSVKAGERVKDKAGACSSMALSVWLLFISCLLWLAEQP